MDKEKYSIIFSSLTGNTKKLADTIRAVLPAEDCDYFGAPKAEELHSEILYIGFWTDKGNADSATLELLSKLRDKKVFLFGTAGFGGSEAYFQKILEHVKQSVGPSNSVFALRLKHRSGGCGTSLAVSALRIMRYCHKLKKNTAFEPRRRCAAQKLVRYRKMQAATFYHQVP